MKAGISSGVQVAIVAIMIVLLQSDFAYQTVCKR